MLNMNVQSQKLSSSSCACCTPAFDQKLDRRRLLNLAGAGVMAGAFMPWRCLAEDICETGKKYEAMVLSCIDPRMQKPVTDYLTDQGLTCNYSQITLAGAAIGAVAPKFKDWHLTFWENLDLTLDIHKIPRVIVINHRDCGAAEAAYGPFERNSKAETQLHRTVLKDFHAQILKHHPQLEVEMLLMGLDGQVQRLGRPQNESTEMNS